ncbi:MAG: hypothetical protein RR790_07905, partial [Eubacterium sp.]
LLKRSNKMQLCVYTSLFCILHEKFLRFARQATSSEKWEVQQAWDKQASFLKAQSQAMRTLQNLIKQYEDMLKSDMATEEQRARIDKIKAEIQHINGEADEIEDLEDIDGAIYGKN